jgi:hypothetical protein
VNALEKPTLVKLCEQMAAHPWTDVELDELVTPKMGIITGLQDLLNALEVLRQTDLGTLPPATNVQHQ